MPPSDGVPAAAAHAGSQISGLPLVPALHDGDDRLDVMAVHDTTMLPHQVPVEEMDRFSQWPFQREV